MKHSINNIAIVGGTHGNELTGIALLQRWAENPAEIQRAGIEVSTLLANPRAFAHNVRYIDNDLNRRFSAQDLQDIALGTYEEARAQAINAQLGPKGDAPKTDFIFDLHTTTSNMGITLVLLSNDPMHLDLVAYIQMQMPECKIFTYILEQDESNYLCSVARHSGLIIEVGPTPQGVLRPDIFEQTRRALVAGMDFFELWNKDQLPELPKTLVGYDFIEKVHFPLDAQGKRCGMIHPALQDQDYQPLNPGDPLFMLFDGSTVTYQGAETCYPCFVNEAAYYDQAHAMSFMRKVELSR